MVCNAPLVICGRQRDVTTGREHWRLEWLTESGWRGEIVERGVAQNTKTITTLADYGAPVNSINGKNLIGYLSGFEEVNRENLPMESVSSHMGWIPDGGFLWGREKIGGQGATRFHPADAGDAKLADAMKAEGGLNEWQAGVKEASQYPTVMAALYSSLCAPLLHIINCSNFIIDFSHATSTGKTTTLRIAASVWGCPDERLPATMVHPWNSTRVFRERAAAVLQNLPVILDDSKTVKKADEIAQTLYDFAGGQGRGRGSKAGLQSSGTWQSVMLSSGEAPATTFTQDGGTRARVLTLWGRPFGEGNQAVLVQNLNSAVTANYGHVGPAFIKWLIDHKEDWPALRNRYKELVAHFAAQAGDNEVGGAAGFLCGGNIACGQAGP